MGGKPTKLVCTQAKAAVLAALDCAKYAVSFDCIHGNLPQVCKAANLSILRIDDLLKCPEAPSFFQSETAKVLKVISQYSSHLIEHGHEYNAATRQQLASYLAYAERTLQAWNAEQGLELSQRQIDDLWTVAGGLQPLVSPSQASGLQPLVSPSQAVAPAARPASAGFFSAKGPEGDRTAYFV